MPKDFMIIAAMENYLSARESQAQLYKDLPLFCRSKDHSSVLDALRSIEEEVIPGKFRPDIFKNFSTCPAIKG